MTFLVYEVFLVPTICGKLPLNVKTLRPHKDTCSFNSLIKSCNTPIRQDGTEKKDPRERERERDPRERERSDRQ